MRGIRTYGWLLALMVLVPSCLMPAEEAADKAVLVATCDHDGECASGLVCDPKAQVCVKDKALSMTGWLRLLPPPQTVMAVEEHYPALSLDNRNDLVLTLHRPVRVQGRVQLEDNDLAIQEAVIVAMSGGDIPDLNIQQDAKATEAYIYDYQNGQTDKPGFEVYVAQDRTYDVYVYLNETVGGQDYPPYHVRRSFSAGGLEGDPHGCDWTIEVPKFERYHRLVGCVLENGDLDTPLVGAKIVAVAPETGNVSTKALTGADGCFDVAVQPVADYESERYEVRVRPSSENELVAEQVVVEVDVAGDLDLGELFVEGFPTLATLLVTVVAQEETLRRDDLPAKQQEEADTMAAERLSDLSSQLVGTAVKLAGKTDSGVLRVERTVSEMTSVTDVEAGFVQVTATLEFVVPPRSYALSIVPPAQSGLGIFQEIHHLAANELAPPPIEIQLKKKAVTTLSVVDAEGDAVDGATVTAILSGQGKYAELTPLPVRKYPAGEGSEPGTYRLTLDEGSYTFVVDPPAESGLPRLVERDNYVQGSSQQRLLTLAEPAAFTGLVYGTLVPAFVEPETGEEGLAPGADSPNGPERDFEVGPAPGVKIELYDALEGLSEPDGIAPIPVATGWSDENGRFVLIVPAE